MKNNNDDINSFFYNLDVHIINVVEEKSTIKNISFPSMSDKLIDICQLTNEVNPNITFNSYYIFDFELFLNEKKLPYLIRDGKIEWNVAIDTVTMSEFICTHKITLSDGITIETGYPMAGGRGGMLDVVEIWANAWLIIKGFAPFIVSSIGFLSDIISLKAWLNNMKTKKRIIFHIHIIFSILSINGQYGIIMSWQKF